MWLDVWHGLGVHVAVLVNEDVEVLDAGRPHLWKLGHRVRDLVQIFDRFAHDLEHTFVALFLAFGSGMATLLDGLDLVVHRLENLTPSATELIHRIMSYLNIE
ncbi:hypothetical protein D3C74_400320 [compost metagenome]